MSAEKHRRLLSGGRASWQRAGRSSGDQCVLSERKRGRHRFRAGSKGAGGHYKRGKKIRKTAGDHELSPNVTDITEMARAAEAGGADVLSLINTLTGMKIDIKRRTFALAKQDRRYVRTVRPVAVRMVYQVAQAVRTLNAHSTACRTLLFRSS